MASYIFLYITLLIGSFADVSKTSRQKRVGILLLFVFAFVLFRGLRWETGTDWEQFYVCFENVEWDNIMSYDRYGNGREKMEVGYMFLNWFIKLFGNYTLFLLVTNLFLVGTWAYMSYKLVPQKFLMTFAMIMVSNMFFPVRLQLAAGVFCWVLYYWLDKKYWLCLLFTIISCLIHKSCCLVIFFIPFLMVEVNGKLMLISVFLTLFSSYIADGISLFVLVLAVLLVPYYPDMANNLVVYSDQEIAGAREVSFIFQILSFVFAFCFMAVFLFVRKKMKKDNMPLLSLEYEKRKYNIYLNSFWLFTLVYKFFSIPSLANFTRVAEFFTLGYAICFMLAYKRFEKRVSPHILFVFYILFYLYKLKGLLNTPYPDEMFPYISIFDFGGRRL
ncbi:EpsG family protein [Phocaeicola sp.]